MGINKKMYKYTAIISMTIVVILIASLMKPLLTIADTTYGISSINYDKNEEVMTVSCSRLDDHVNSFLYWIYTDEDIPTKEDLDELAVWCVRNAIKVVPVDTISKTDSIKIRKTGKYYAVLLLKKVNEEGTEEYVKAFIAYYVVNTPIKVVSDEDVEEEEAVKGNDSEEEQEPEVGPEVEPEVQPEVEPEVQPEVEPEVQPEVEPEVQQEVEPEVQPEVEPEVQQEVEPEVGPEIEPETQPENQQQGTDNNLDEYTELEPETTPDQQPTQDSDETDEPIYIDVNRGNNDNNNTDDYLDIPEENNRGIQETNQNQDNKDTKTEKDDKNKVEENDETETMSGLLPSMSEIKNSGVAKETLPQTGSNSTPAIIGIVLFSIIGCASFVKYLKINNRD